jgi:hypothetical protein
MKHNYEEEYFELCSSDIRIYPTAYEECEKLNCPRTQDCPDFIECPAYYTKTTEIIEPKNMLMQLCTDKKDNKIMYSDIILAIPRMTASFLISNKLYKSLYDKNIFGIQFISTTLYEKDIVKYNDFWYVHIFNYLSLLDMTQSFFATLNDCYEISNELAVIKFNDNLINSISLDKRLIFRLKDVPNYIIVHKSIMDIIMDCNPIGVTFKNIKENYSSKKNTELICE